MQITVAEWIDRPTAITLAVQERFADRMLVVRSSACDEDGTQFSRAGAYDSVLGVPSDDCTAIGDAINKVISSYRKDGRYSGEDQVILQEMVQGTVMSGVVFTHDLNTGAPYYVINYDDVSGLTNTVTSGEGKYANRTLYVHRSAATSLRSPRFQRLLEAIQELEHVIDSEFLDIEFGLAPDFSPCLFQVRAITTQTNWNRAITKRVDSALEGIQRFVKNRLARRTGVYGTTTVFAQMSDWNPAEMIGRAPRALAMSLYRGLITDKAWRMGREAMGYSVPVGQPLMVSLGGQPFIDVGLSLHSFIPSDIEPITASKLVDHWLKVLIEQPQLHDKIEFDLAITAYSFDIDDKLNTLVGSALNSGERSKFKSALLHLTKKLIFDRFGGTISSANAKIRELVARQRKLAEGTTQHSIHLLNAMVEDCVSYGTVPFAILARHAFIAKTMMNSLVRCGILSADDLQCFQGSIRTVASDFVEDSRLLQSGALALTDFMARYGHLRPGTYDILSLRYDQMDYRPLDDSNALASSGGLRGFQFNLKQEKEIRRLFLMHGFEDLSVEEFFAYVRDATVGREYAKFVFSKSVSDMLEVIANFGEINGLSRDELSHIPLTNFIEIGCASDAEKIEDKLREYAVVGADRHVSCAAIRLPQVLFDEAGVRVVPFQVSEPNFVTQKSVSGRCVLLTAESFKPSSPKGALALSDMIVLIESADPGFDWIFSHKIKGLVTKYGGVNSHMAIRCAEFGIPAAIGCGEQRFETLVRANHLRLDCSTCSIETY